MGGVGDTPMPEDFRYRDVFDRGMPRHGRYDDFRIKHPSMDTGRRAKIFAPFDALTGFGDSVASKDIIYGDRPEPGEEDAERIESALRRLRELTRNGRAARENRPAVKVTYYEPCSDTDSEWYGKKGLTVTVTGICSKVDPVTERALFAAGRKIPLEDITDIELL